MGWKVYENSIFYPALRKNQLNLPKPQPLLLLSSDPYYASK